jgi:nucleotide-binding universal stress UspA family protein
MDTTQKILFGIADLESARPAIAATGDLLKGKKNVNVTIFHGALDADLSSLARLLRLAPGVVEEHRKICDLREQELLEQAKGALVDSGFDVTGVTTVCEGKCHDPAAAILRLANWEGFDPIVLARRKERLLERMLMGSVTYRVVRMAEWRAVWLMDPPVASRDVLVALVGAPISRRVMEHAVQHFAHLQESRFTLFHVIPPLPPVYWDDTRILSELEREEREKTTAQWMDEYEERVRTIAADGKGQLLAAGVREENVAFKIQPARRGMAGDILSELAEGNYGILVIGRKGSKEISPFQLGSIADKLLHNARGCMTCLVG